MFGCSDVCRADVRNLKYLFLHHSIFIITIRVLHIVPMCSMMCPLCHTCHTMCYTCHSMCHSCHTMCRTFHTMSHTCTLCALFVHIMCSICPHYVLFMFTIMCSMCPLCVLYLSTLLYVLYMSPLFAVFVPIMCSICPHYMLHLPHYVLF